MNLRLLLIISAIFIFLMAAVAGTFLYLLQVTFEDASAAAERDEIGRLAVYLQNNTGRIEPEKERQLIRNALIHSKNTREEMLKLLTAKELDFYGESPNQSPLVFAMRGGWVSPGDLFVLDQAGFDFNERFPNGDTLLHVMADHPNSGDEIAGLIKAGADPSLANDRGQTPLHIMLANASLEGRRYDLASLMLENGADLYARDADGFTAFEYMSVLEPWLQRLMLDLGADLSRTNRRFPDRPVIFGIVGSEVFDMEAFALYMENAEDPFATDGSGKNLLHLAVEHDRKDLIPLMLTAGFDPEFQAENGVPPPVDWALIHGTPQAAKLLLDAGATPQTDPKILRPEMQQLLPSAVAQNADP